MTNRFLIPIRTRIRSTLESLGFMLLAPQVLAQPAVAPDAIQTISRNTIYARTQQTAVGNHVEVDCHDPQVSTKKKLIEVMFSEATVKIKTPPVEPAPAQEAATHTPEEVG